MTLPNPELMLWTEWVRETVREYPDAPHGMWMAEREWRQWAYDLIFSEALGTEIPQPALFGDWKEWARRVKESLE